MINEIFFGIQGEGKTQGQYRQFIRFNTCNLCCNFCDTAYALGKGDKHIELHEQLYSHIVISGGEPCLENNWQFIKENILFKKEVQWIEVETNGTIIPFFSDLNLINLWNISPKNPKDQIKKDIICEPVLLKYKENLKDYIVKFVIKDESDLEFVKEIQDKYAILQYKIWLMPYTNKDGSSNSELVYDLAFKNEYNFSARLHVLIKGNKRGI